jgi:hypothetical protein
LALVTALGLAGALGLDTTLAFGTLFGLARLLGFAATFDLGAPFGLAEVLGFVFAFDLSANFLLTLGATFRGVLVIFPVTEAFFFLDLIVLSLLDPMDPSSDKNVRKLTAVHIRAVIKTLIS